MQNSTNTEKTAFGIQSTSISKALIVTWRGESLKDLCLQAFWYEVPIDLAYASWPCIHVVAWLLRAKLCAIIDQHKLLILNVYNYVRLTIAIDIPNFTGDGS